MFHNDNMPSFSQRSKYKIFKTKNSKSQFKEPIPKHSKNLRNSKSKKKRHSKFKHINSESDFVGPERLTKHVGFFTKGKISNSISRFEKVMPKELRARARQDLKEVLNLNSNNSSPDSEFLKPNDGTKSKYQKHNSGSISDYQNRYSSKSLTSDEAHTSQHSSSRNSQHLHYNSRFSSNSWKDKIQKSVGNASVNSVLASVQKPQKKSPIKELQLLARKIIIKKIHPAIMDANTVLHSNVSNNRDKLKSKLQKIKSELNLCIEDDSRKNSSFSRTDSSQMSPFVDIKNSKKEEFHLNPIYTGEDFDQNGISKIFPNADEFPNHVTNLISEAESVNLPNEIYDFERISCPVPSPSIRKEDSLTIIPSSPTTSDDSPAWKLELSPVKFEPNLKASPKIYYRHKMF